MENSPIVNSLERSIDRIENELPKINSAISEISTELKILNLNVKHISEEQKEIKEELGTHSERLNDASQYKLEFKNYVDSRLMEIEISPARTAMKEKDYVKQQILTAAVTGLMVLLGTVFTNSIIKTHEQPKQEIKRRDSETESKNGENPLVKIAKTEKKK